MTESYLGSPGNYERIVLVFVCQPLKEHAKETCRPSREKIQRRYHLLAKELHRASQGRVKVLPSPRSASSCQRRFEAGTDFASKKKEKGKRERDPSTVSGNTGRKTGLSKTNISEKLYKRSRQQQIFSSSPQTLQQTHKAAAVSEKHGGY